MIEKYFASFVDPRSAEVFAQGDKEFLKACCDFASFFDLRVAPPLVSRSIGQVGKAGMFSRSGLYVGTLAYLKNYSSSGGEYYYSFEAPTLICKQRSSRNSGRYTRDSEKISNLIKAIVKANEQPEETKLLRQARNAVRYAFGCVLQSGANAPRLDLDQQALIALIESHLNVNPQSVGQYESMIQQKYDDYLIALDRTRLRGVEHDRFKKGSHFIYVTDTPYHAPAYIVGKAVETGVNALPVLSGYTRYETLQGTEHAALAAMVRTYSLGKEWGDEGNEFGLSRIDRHFPDLDISVGYDTTDRGFCVVFPEEGPSLADA